MCVCGGRQRVPNIWFQSKLTKSKNNRKRCQHNRLLLCTVAPARVYSPHIHSKPVCTYIHTCTFVILYKHSTCTHIPTYFIYVNASAHGLVSNIMFRPRIRTVGRSFFFFLSFFPLPTPGYFVTFMVQFVQSKYYDDCKHKYTRLV